MYIFVIVKKNTFRLDKKKYMVKVWPHVPFKKLAKIGGYVPFII